MKPSPFAKKGRVKPQKIMVDPDAMVKTRTDGGPMPLIVEPATPDLDGPAWLAGQRDHMEELLAKHGAILFRGFDLESQADFENFAAALYPELYETYGDLPKASGRVYGATPYPHNDPILFHNEASHTHCWPTRQFFFCHTVASSGGATVIADCRALYQSLTEEERALFAEKGLMYTRNFIEGVDVSWQDFFRTESKDEMAAMCAERGISFEWQADGGLHTSQKGPAIVRHPRTDELIFFNQIQLHHPVFLPEQVRSSLQNLYGERGMPRCVYFGDGTPISDALARKLEAQAWEHSVDVCWQKGDVVMLDNMLITHGRKVYELPRKIYVVLARIMKQSELKPLPLGP